jgi:hypothetical protein
MEENFSQEEKSCLVCDYEFSINNLPEISIFRITTPITERSFQEKETQAYFQEVSSYKSPRAPPFLFI